VVPPCRPDATDGADTPFGHRWGGEIATLTPAHLAAIKSGQTLALDVQNEYVLFLRSDTPSTKRLRPKRGHDD
jgi:hypothetical protein